MENFIKKIDNFISEKNLIPKKSRIILGFSGGPDSMFLLHFLSSRYDIIAAYLDHEWRKESKKEENFCANSAKALNVPFISNKISKLGISFKKGSKEEIGRKSRRYFLEKILKEKNANLIAMGHHLQDQEETFFIRLIRGSTLSGLASIRPKSGPYIRPLLKTDKAEIINYLNKNKIKYIKDPTNLSESFLRNRIRKKVIPALRECDSRFDSNFINTLEKIQEAEIFLEKETEKSFIKISENSSLNLTNFLKLDVFLQYRIIIYWLCKEKLPFTLTQKFLKEILRFIKQPNNKEHKIHQKWSLIKKNKFLSLKR